MAGRIPQNFIDDLISRTDIVEIINARVPLKRKGKEHTACCPFHNEKTPSFTVSESKQFYHCFGCGAHGTALGFLMEYENLDFIDAVETLAAEYNLDVPRENSGQLTQITRDEKKPLYDILDKVTVLFQQQLKTSDKAIQYLKQRELTGGIAKTFNLGYAPDGWAFLSNAFKNNTSEINDLITTGLLVKKDDGQNYDRFRDRIMFPITDRRGQVIGFGGRVIDQGEPKYLNSPENPVFHKGLELYGMYEAKQATRKLERFIIVEGYMDVVALAQNGIEYAVATLGTATTTEQLLKTFRTVSEIVFCYDGDTAGQKAAWRALKNTLPVIRDGQIAKFLFLPENEDPDSMIRKEGKEKFEQRFDSATPLSDYLFDTLKQKTDITSDDGKARLSELARPLLAGMNDSVFKDLLFDKLSQLVGVTVENLAKYITQKASEKKILSHSASQTIQTTGPSNTRKAIALLIQYPSLVGVQSIPNEFVETEIKGLPLLYKLHNDIIQNPEITTAAILERYRNTPEETTLHKLTELEIPGIKDLQQRIDLYKDIIRKLYAQLHEAPHAARQLELENKHKSGKFTEEEKQEYLSLISGKH